MSTFKKTENAYSRTILMESTDKKSVIDIKALHAQFIGDEDIMRAVILNFLNSYPNMLENIQIAIASQDPISLQHTAHKLKGCISNFFAYELQKILNELEGLGRSKDLSGANLIYEELLFQINDLCQEMNFILIEAEKKGAH